MIHLAGIPIDKHIAAIEISVDDAGIMQVQIIQPIQNLFRPLLKGLHGNMPMLLPILPQIATSTNLGDEIQSVTLLIPPHTVKGNDAFVFQASQQPHFRVKPIHHCRVITKVPQLHLVPCHLYSFFLIKCTVHFLHSTTPKQLTVSTIATSWIGLNKCLRIFVRWVRVNTRHLSHSTQIRVSSTPKSNHIKPNSACH